MHDAPPVLYINQLLPSTLRWEALGLNITLRSSLLDEACTGFASASLHFAAPAAPPTVHLKVPSLAESDRRLSSTLQCAKDSCPSWYGLGSGLAGGSRACLGKAITMTPGSELTLDRPHTQVRLPDWTASDNATLALDGDQVPCSFASEDGAGYCSIVRTFRTGATGCACWCGVLPACGLPCARDTARTFNKSNPAGVSAASVSSFDSSAIPPLLQGSN